MLIFLMLPIWDIIATGKEAKDPITRYRHWHLPGMMCQMLDGSEGSGGNIPLHDIEG